MANPPPNGALQANDVANLTYTECDAWLNLNYPGWYTTDVTSTHMVYAATASLYPPHRAVGKMIRLAESSRAQLYRELIRRVLDSPELFQPANGNRLIPPGEVFDLQENVHNNTVTITGPRQYTEWLLKGRVPGESESLLRRLNAFP